jgi:hypothetical protein
LRGEREAKLFRLAAGRGYVRQHALDWLETVIEEGRSELEAQHALQCEVEGWDMSCRIMFWVTLS